MEFFVLFVIAVFIALSIIVKKTKKQVSSIEQIATDLNLEYGDNLKHLVGKYQGRRVEIHQYQNSQQAPITQFRLFYKQQQITDFIAQPGKNSTRKAGYSEVKIEDSSFNDAVLLQATNVAEAKEYFGNDRLRAALVSLFSKSKFKWPSLNQRYVEVYTQEICKNGEDARDVLRNLIYCTDLFESANLSLIEASEAKSKPKLKAKYAEKKPPKLPHLRESVEEAVAEPKAAILEEIEALAPPEAEIEPIDTAETPEPEPTTAEATTASPKTPASQKGVPYQDVWKLLIEDKPSHYQAGNQFKHLMANESVSWSAELETISPGSSDRNFGVSRGGWIAEYSTPDGVLNIKYRISEQRKQSLESNPNQLIEGKLIKYNSFSNTLYIDSGDEIVNERGYRSKVVSYAERLEKRRAAQKV